MTHHIMRSLNCALLAVALAACGSEDSDGSSDSSEQGGRIEAPVKDGRTMAYGASDRPMNGIESLTFSQTGDVETVSEFDVDKLGFTGGCIKDEGLGIIFMDNSRIQEPTYFLLSMESDNSPAAGQTGTFTIEKVSWANGKEPIPEMQGIMGPVMFEGSGQLTITEHEGGGLDGRMKAQLTADLTEKQGGDTASITADFDIYWGCKDSAFPDL